MKKGTKIAIAIVVIFISVVIVFAGLLWITFIQQYRFKAIWWRQYGTLAEWEYTRVTIQFVRGRSPVTIIINNQFSLVYPRMTQRSIPYYLELNESISTVIPPYIDYVNITVYEGNDITGEIGKTMLIPIDMPLFYP